MVILVSDVIVFLSIRKQLSRLTKSLTDKRIRRRRRDGGRDEAEVEWVTRVLFLLSQTGTAKLFIGA